MEKSLQEQLDQLLAQAPRRENFLTEEAYQEANSGFQHRAGPSIRTLRSLVSQRSQKSPVTAK